MQGKEADVQAPGNTFRFTFKNRVAHPGVLRLCRTAKNTRAIVPPRHAHRERARNRCRGRSDMLVV